MDYVKVVRKITPYSHYRVLNLKFSGNRYSISHKKGLRILLEKVKFRFLIKDFYKVKSE
ncbi:hypothetical protein T11_13953 [Trichinella zimbabwensis]|uniref:Uncharacterized protein n=1 Tax=Trichinella zimbabwensis TaxID=268475 RepID=A0A0V1GKT3_9BILA|nr:hypothetical protein T11_7334 [Trichinella zimbabwensis]KRY98901.1 hypothetical protein T11_13953 [Trichinella zimbabwensis]